jgi:hypothetical protein
MTKLEALVHAAAWAATATKLRERAIVATDPAYVTLLFGLSQGYAIADSRRGR